MSTTTLTPMMTRYQSIKAALPKDSILLFRLGDFYEAFFEDAEIMAAHLDLTLTKRNGTPMCGFPVHGLDRYIGRLLGAVHTVALSNQTKASK